MSFSIYHDTICFSMHTINGQSLSNNKIYDHPYRIQFERNKINAAENHGHDYSEYQLFFQDTIIADILDFNKFKFPIVKLIRN